MPCPRGERSPSECPAYMMLKPACSHLVPAALPTGRAPHDATVAAETQEGRRELLKRRARELTVAAVV